MERTRFDIVIVGGGLASAKAIGAYRDAGGDGTICLVSRDSELPYHRPPLSKAYLRGGERAAVFVEDEGFYAESGVEVVLGTRATAVRPGEREVETEAGARLRYGTLVLATGAWPRRLGVPGEELEGVHTLRTLADSTRIREAAAGAGRALVVGAGFIGMEVAASLRSQGLEVTLVHRGPALFDGFGSPEVSRFLAGLYRDRGVELVLEDSVAELRGNGRLAEAVTAGGRRIEAGLAVVGVGVEPEVAVLDGSGVEVDDGVVVDERFRASAPDVYAVGDVARFDDPVLGGRRRIEHWSNANYQGAELGRILAGEGKGYDRVSSFFTEVFGTTLKTFGAPERHDELVHRGALEEGRTIGFYLQGGRLCGALTAGQDEDVESTLTELVRARAAVADRDRLPLEDVPLGELFDASAA